MIRRLPLRPGKGFARGGRIVYRPDPTDAMLDKLCAKYVKTRDNYTCQWPTCGTVYAPGSRGLQWAHLVSRRYLKTRWNPEASVALCTAHHFFLDGNPHAKIAFAVKRLGEARYDALRLQSQAAGKVDREAVRLALQRQTVELEGSGT